VEHNKIIKHQQEVCLVDNQAIIQILAVFLEGHLYKLEFKIPLLSQKQKVDYLEEIQVRKLVVYFIQNRVNLDNLPVHKYQHNL
jgi:hypothetical protein